MFVIVLYFFSLSILLHSLPFPTLPCVLGGSPSRITSTVCVGLFVFTVLFCFSIALWLQEQDRSSDVLSRMTLRYYFQPAPACCAKAAHRHGKSQSLSEPCHTTLSASDFSTTLFCSSSGPGVDHGFFLQYYLVIS